MSLTNCDAVAIYPKEVAALVRDRLELGPNTVDRHRVTATLRKSGAVVVAIFETEKEAIAFFDNLQRESLL